jgi:hypothetical protein
MRKTKNSIQSNQSMGLTSREKRESFLYLDMDKFFYIPLYIQVVNTSKDAHGKYQNELTVLIVERFIKRQEYNARPDVNQTGHHHPQNANTPTLITTRVTKNSPPIQSGL